MKNIYPLDKLSFPEREERVFKRWEADKIFEESVKKRQGAPYFTFYDGPPFATGLPHYGHLLAGTIKDVVPRYKTMKGFYVPRRFGWDCHGLPVENEIEKEKNLQGAKEIKAFGIDKFNEACRQIVLRYTEEWKSSVKRMGRWVDFDNVYKTMDPTFMESVWWVFKQLYEKGLVYQGFKVLPYSAKLGTPLSNFEAGENYKDVDDPAITVRFELEEMDASILAWTTTPWTLISNLALIVGPDIPYVLVVMKESGRKVILAKSCLPLQFKSESEYEIVKEMLGKELEGMRYKPLFPYFKNQPGAFRVILEPQVSLEEGTGVVHSAPAFGEVDFYACQAAGISLVCPVDENGRFTQEIGEYAGLFVKDADKAIIRRLKEEGQLFHQATIHHRYPFCWRSDTPLIYKAVSSWYVAVEKIKDRLIAANQQIHWTPGYLKEGRFGKWLEGARDWAISRNRYFGTPIPIWISTGGKVKVIGSCKELEELTGTKIVDLHRHHIDSLKFTIDGEEYQRIEEVFDCWFESGSMPYAQIHYPFEQKEFFEHHFPADFIAEGLDQTRGWFYTLTILAAALFDSPAFKNVVVNGIVLAADGQKMSKRLRNYPDPMEMVHKYGADAIRLYMLSSPAVRADDLCFTEGGVELVLRQVLIPFWNAYQFFATYANISQFKPFDMKRPTALIDRWILSSLQHLIQDVEAGMDDYNLQKAVEPLVGFIDQLTNWYIRRSRRRFWSEEKTQDQDEAFQTLYQVLVTLSKIASPFIPFLAEEIYGNLAKGSVHLTDYPAYEERLRDIELEEAMEAAKTSVSLGHALRKEYKLKVRQPLSAAYIASSNGRLLDLLRAKKELIMDELNVKQLYFSDKEEEFVHLKAKPNFRILGKKVGGKMPLLQKLINGFDQKLLAKVMIGEEVTIELDSEPLTLLPGEVEVEREVREGVIAKGEGEITIALNPELNHDLILEGLSREIVNKINTMRREKGMEVTDRIKVAIEATPIVKEAFESFRGYIINEVLATDVDYKANGGEQWDMNGELVTIDITKT